MRKIIILGLLAATVVPSVASAQSYGEARRSEQRLREDQKWLGLSEQPLTFDKWIVCGLVVQAAACGASWRSGVARPE
ncbi:hypothetical protein VHN57_23250 [Sphingobium sp. WW5]|uniref:hypothetical protein n=1 Tax=unclassified Sphingobium TaxID=2611147 RepID=UPI003C201EF7